MSNIYNIIEKLKIAKENDKLVIFAGAGISKNSGFPLWDDFLKLMGKEIKSDITNEDIKQNMLKIPQLLYQKDGSKYNEILKNTFIHRDPNLINYKILELMPKHIITTNYDDLFESCVSPNALFYDVVYSDKQLLSATKKHYILKMHGSIEDINSIVLKEEDYFKFSEKHPAIETFIKSLLIDHTILFLGYSLSDMDLNLIINWVAYLKEQLGNKFSNKYYILADKNDSKLNVDLTEYYNQNGITIIDNDDFESLNLDSKEYIALHEKAKKIYTLLDYIESGKNSITNYIEFNLKFIKKDDFISKQFIKSLLNLKNYEFMAFQLNLYNDKDVAKVVELLSSSIGSRLKELFYRAGVCFVVDMKSGKTILDESNNSFSCKRDLFYDKFMSFNYISLFKALNKHNDQLSEFYYKNYFNYWYNVGKGFLDIKFNRNWQMNDILSFYINRNYSRNLIAEYKDEVYKFDNVFNSLSEHDKIKYSYFKKIDSNFTSDVSQLNKELLDLENNYLNDTNKIFLSGDSLFPLYKIQSVSYEILSSCFKNNILLNHFTNLKSLMRIYISAMLCSNTHSKKSQNSIFSDEFSNARLKAYELSQYDLSIIINFIEPKDLSKLIKKYNVIEFGSEKSFIELFSNFSKSIRAEIIYFDDKILSMFANFCNLFNIYQFKDREIQKMFKVLNDLILNTKILDFIFDLRNRDICKIFFSFLAKYSSEIPIKLRYIITEYLLKHILEKGFSVIGNNFSSFKKVIKFKKEIKEDFLNNLSELPIDKRVNISFAFYNFFDTKHKTSLKDFINTNFDKLNEHQTIIAVSSNLMKLDEKKLQFYIERARKVLENNDNRVHLIPDPQQSQLEFLQILILLGNIKDLTEFTTIKTEDLKLKFLLNPKQFKEYNKIDLKDYMWANIYKCKKYQKYFIENREVIKELYLFDKERRLDSDDEKKFVYKFILDDKNIWDPQF